MNNSHTSSFDVSQNGAVANGCEKYCLFRLGSQLIAVLAETVREVSLRPAITPIPFVDPIVAGLSHIRNEFLPVLRLESNAGRDQASQQFIVFSGADGPWALLVDEVIGLFALEVSISVDTGTTSGWSAAVMGSATFENQIVHVLDAQALFRLAAETVDRFWQQQLPAIDAPA